MDTKKNYEKKKLNLIGKIITVERDIPKRYSSGEVEFFNNLETFKTDVLEINIDEAKILYNSLVEKVKNKKIITSFIINSISQYILVEACQENGVIINTIDPRKDIDGSLITDSDLAFVPSDMEDAKINDYLSKTDNNVEIIKIDDKKLLKKINVIENNENEKAR